MSSKRFCATRHDKDILHRLEIQMRGDYSDFVSAAIYYGDEDGELYYDNGDIILRHMIMYTKDIVYSFVDSNILSDSKEIFWHRVPRNPSHRLLIGKVY